MTRLLSPLLLSACLAIPLGAKAAPVDHAAIGERAFAVLDRQFSAFRSATDVLSETAVDFCDGTGSQEALEQAITDAWRAWAPLDSYQFGPVEQTGAALSVDFWPDKKDFVGRGLDALQTLPEADQSSTEGIAAVSAAAQGLPALERLITTDLEVCPAAIGISAHLQAMAGDLYDGWFAPDGWADLMRAAGPDNPIYLSSEEVSRTLFTAADFGLTRVADYRLGRPLGTYERNYPRRAEAWRLGLSATIAEAQLAGVEALVEEAFGPALSPETTERYATVSDAARERLEDLGEPLHEAVTATMGHLRVEAVQTRVVQLRSILAEDMGPELGIETGFSAADGD